MVLEEVDCHHAVTNIAKYDCTTFHLRQPIAPLSWIVKELSTKLPAAWYPLQPIAMEELSSAS